MFLIPTGLSMAAYQTKHNKTLAPDFFYFSYQAKGTKIEDRLVSLCSTASASAHCFLGKGQSQFSKIQRWAEDYIVAHNLDTPASSSRRLHAWHQHHWGSTEGRQVGREIR